MKRAQTLNISCCLFAKFFVQNRSVRHRVTAF